MKMALSLPGAARISHEGRYLIWAALAALVAITAALFLVDAEVERTLDHEEERAARRELSLLQDLSAEEGEAAVIKTITRHMRVGDSEVIFALKGGDGELYGSASAWPEVQRDDAAWGPLDVSRDDGPERAVGLMSLLPDGSIVLIGNDLSGRDRIRAASLAGLALALGLVTALAFALGAQINRVGRMRVAAISRTAEEVMAGRLNARVPVERERDVFDHLGRVVNQMLDRLEALFAAMRAVTDSLAHDLRTPLNRLKAALERAALASNGEAAAEIERAQNEADRLASTFSSLIDIARAESGLSEEAMEVVDLKNLTEGLVDLFSSGRRRPRNAYGCFGAGLVSARPPPAFIPGDREPDRQRDQICAGGRDNHRRTLSNGGGRGDHRRRFWPGYTARSACSGAEAVGPSQHIGSSRRRFRAFDCGRHRPASPRRTDVAR
ncbi:MAG: HAMP domain-containing sensor histidine kinase [Alphaproteobacteria bacterium]